MEKQFIDDYEHIRSAGLGYYPQSRGLIAVWGKEAVQFLDGMISNDMKTLEDGQQMLAAFPNAQGRLIAVIRVLRQGDRFLIETEEVTREKVFQNLFRFTFAGDFFVEDLSNSYRYFEVYGGDGSVPPAVASGVAYTGRGSTDNFIEVNSAEASITELLANGSIQIDGDLHETLRIESGIPLYGIDMDETTIVPELGLDGLISYNKGCYIGQEIIARIHFRGHVAKRLTGLVSKTGAMVSGFLPGTELAAEDGKNAGRITSVVYSPSLERHIALAFVRYDYLAAGTELRAGEATAVVTDLPFIG